jgi:hypothetical protein
MTLPNDPLTGLLARRGDLYERLRMMDDRVADAQRSPFFGTLRETEPTIRDSIERTEDEIGEVDWQIAGLRGRNG